MLFPDADYAAAATIDQVSGAGGSHPRALEAWVGEILPDGTVGNAHQVAGGPDESVFQPEWSPDGNLFFISDRGGGWWNLYRYRDGASEPMASMDAEFGRPQWKFGMSTYAFESDERLICCFVRDGVWKLAQVDTRTKRFDLIPTELTDISQVRAGPGRVVFFGGSPSQPLALIDLNLSIARWGPTLCLKPGADCIPYRGGRDRPRVLLSAVFARGHRASR